MWPTSRLVQVAKSEKTNIKSAIKKHHEHWHTLFENKTPLEAVIFVIEQMAPLGYFTKVEIHASYDGTDEVYTCTYPGTAVRPQYVRPAQYEAWYHLFGQKDWIFAIKEMIQNWAPAGAFSYFRLESVHRDREVIVTSDVS